MKSAIFRTLTILSLFTATQAFAALQAQMPSGWGFQNIPNGSLLSKMTGGAVAVFTKPGAEDLTKTKPTVRVYTFENTDVSALKEDKALWRKTLFGEKSKKFAVVSEDFVTVGQEKRYFIEFQSDIGTESMLNSAALAMIVKGKLVLLIYEQQQIFYRNQITDVKDLFSKVTLK